MARRMLAWLLVTPLAAVGVLAAHAAAYAVTGRALGEEHGYLEHAPQVAGLLASLALIELALQERSLRPWSAWWVAPSASPTRGSCRSSSPRRPSSWDSRSSCRSRPFASCSCVASSGCSQSYSGD